MQKIAIIFSLICINLPVCAVVWENDPTITPEQREQRREHNKRMRERNEERGLIKQQKIAQAAERYVQKIDEIKQRDRKLEREKIKNREIYDATQAYLEEIKKIEEEYAPLIG